MVDRSNQDGNNKIAAGWMPAQTLNFTEDISMSFSVVTNMSSLEAQTSLTKTHMGLEQTLSRLSSGLRINSAADDAAGLAIANRDMLDNTGLQGITSLLDRAIDALQR